MGTETNCMRTRLPISGRDLGRLHERDGIELGLEGQKLEQGMLVTQNS